MTTGTDANPITFEPVEFQPSITWRQISSFAFVGRLPQIPLSDSELLQSSHHLPLAIDCSSDRLQVVAITAGPFQRTPLLNTEGRWQRGYTPIALRCFPFRYSGSTLEIATNAGAETDATLPLLSSDGSATPEIKNIIALLRRLEVGKQRLHAAAERLLIAGVLTPFQMMKLPDTAILSPLLTVDRNKFNALSDRRVAQIARDDFLPLDVAAACLFSQRLTPAAISVAKKSADIGEPSRATGQTDIEFGSGIELDDSELFSFETFDRVDHLS